MLSFRYVRFLFVSSCFFLEGHEGRNFSVMLRFSNNVDYFRRYARRLILEICFPIYFGVVEKWWFGSRKRRPKIKFNLGKSASASPGRPRRSHLGGIDTFPHFRLGFGDKVCGVKFVCYCSCVIVGGLLGFDVSAVMFRKKC